MKSRPIDTYANNRSGIYKIHNREFFAFSPSHLDSNVIRDTRWWNTNMFFRRMYRDTAVNFKFSTKPKMQ